MVIPKPSELKDFSKFEDAALLKLIAAKQPEALEALYRRHGRSIFNQALRLCGRAVLAEDVTLAVFLQAWEKAGDILKAPHNTTDWLSEIQRSYYVDLSQRAETACSGEEGIPADLPPEAEEPPAGLKRRLMREVKKRKSILQRPRKHAAS